jgi:RNA polymerase sigma-70 factor (ECF subfamily)
MSQHEEPLAARLRDDLDNHFQQLVETYQHQLYRLMLRQVGSVPDAEDLVQETFLRAYYALRNYTAQGVTVQNIRSWLFKIAFNLSYNRFRGLKPPLVPLDAPEGEQWFDLEYPGPGPEDLAGHEESMREVAAAIAALPEHYRVVLNLYYFQQLSYQEIADCLQQPLGTIKSKVYRSLGLVRATLAQNDGQRSV